MFVTRQAVMFLILSSLALPRPARAYPTDEYARTGIRRLQWQYEVDQGIRKSRGKLPPGATWTHDKIQLRLLKVGNDFELKPDTAKDPALQKGLEEILQRNAFRKYNVAILDLTDPAHPRWAGVHENEKQTPGSVAKVLVAAGVLRLLKERFPDDIAKREELLKTVMVAADDWAKVDSHEVPIVTGEKLENVAIRKVKTGDTFSLWEWMDHAISPSNNSAAAMTWREGMLMRLLGNEYPPKKWDAELFKRWDRQAMTDASFDVVDRPLKDAGLDLEAFNVYMYFTTTANKYIFAKSSDATPLALLQWTVKMEQGKMVDEWSSLELKKMLYLTRRRVRYAQAPELKDSAVWFKSGSLFICTPETKAAGACVQYEGDATNVLNALVEVETPIVPEIQADPVVPTANSPAAAVDAKAPAADAKTLAAAPTPVASAKNAGGDVKAAAAPALPPGVAKDGKRHVYVVAVMSNELKRNAAADHGKLASELHKLILGE
jgi:hypothetical protein